MSATISAITTSSVYQGAVGAASSIGGYILWVAGSAWSGLGAAANWSAYTALPTVGQGAIDVGSAIVQGLSWTAFTAVPTTLRTAAHTITQIGKAILSAPFVIAQAAQALWLSYPIQAALLTLTVVAARHAVDQIETNSRIQSLPLKGRVLARFIAAMSIAGVAVSCGPLAGLAFTSYKLYAVALTLFAAIDGTTRAFLQNTLNQYNAGTENAVPISVRFRGNLQRTFDSFNAGEYTFSGNLTAELDNALLGKAKNFSVRPGGWIELAEWMTNMNPQGDEQKAYAIALWMHLVETYSPIETPKGKDLTVFYNHTAWAHTIKIANED